MYAFFRKYERSLAWFDMSAWVFIVLGAALFSARIALPDDWMLNLPQLVTLVQVLGGMLLIIGFTLIVSRIFWLDIKVRTLLDAVLNQHSQAAAQVILGLMVFNALVVLSFAVFVALLFMGGFAK